MKWFNSLDNSSLSQPAILDVKGSGSSKLFLQPRDGSPEESCGATEGLWPLEERHMSATSETHKRLLLTCLKRKDVNKLGNSRHKGIVPKRIDIKNAVVIRKVHRTSQDTCAYAELGPLTASSPSARRRRVQEETVELENLRIARVPWFLQQAVQQAVADSQMRFHATFPTPPGCNAVRIHDAA